MNATSPVLSDCQALIAAIKASPLDKTIRVVYADACDEAGDHATATAIRSGKWQATEEGEQIVVVGRDGADHYSHGGIYTTKVYEAIRRQRDGRLTWRLVRSIRSHRTAGKTVTGPMIRRAEEYAESLGLPVATHITHGTVCI